jgi:SepF-like predicted cell division protein (DUF552 family)
MGLFDKLLGKGEAGGEALDIQEIVEGAADIVTPPADFYVKKIELRNEGDADLVIKELSSKNIILLNVTPIAKQPNRLKGIIGKLKVNANKTNGDIALLEESVILLTPANVKIVKSKPKPARQ